jgi:hypothetical protein
MGVSYLLERLLTGMSLPGAFVEEHPDLPIQGTVKHHPTLVELYYSVAASVTGSSFRAASRSNCPILYSDAQYTSSVTKVVTSRDKM